MNEQLFRKKSLDKVSSPEQLNEYIRVSNPGIWMVLTAIVVLLIGVIAWGYVARLDTTLSAAIVPNEGKGIIYVRETDVEKLSEGMTVRTNDNKYVIEEISKEAVRLKGELSEYAMHASGLAEGEWAYKAYVSGKFDDGVHKAEIVLESISPISFILN